MPAINCFVCAFQGAQIFEAVGLSREVMDLCFSGSASRIGGVHFTDLAKEVGDHANKIYYLQI